MKKNVLIMCLVWLFLLSSCGFFGPQQYVCDAEEVDSAQIIQLGQFNEEENEFEYTVLAQISDIEAFVSRLNKVNHSVNWVDPGVMPEEYAVIKINYKNGDYDLLYRNAQTYKRVGIYQTGYFFFDEKEFDSLISDYLQE